MQQLLGPLAVVAACAVLAFPRLVSAQATPEIPRAITTPDRLETRLGTFEFKDGTPSQGTIEKIYDNLDLMLGVEAFVKDFQGASTSAIVKETSSAGIPNNTAPHGHRHGALNNGEDFTRPVRRFDLRERYERLPDDDGLEPEKWVTTLRTDVWRGFGERWKLYGRADLPLVYANDVTSSSNPEGHGRFGLGDLLTEVAIIPPPPTPRLGYGFGVRVVWPTTDRTELGNGHYQIGPVVGVRSMLPEISSGSFFLIKVRYQNSIASRDENEGSADVNRLNIQPKLNVNLPSEWFLTLFASESIEINFADGGKYFFPFDLMVGKKLGKNLVVSVEYSRELFHDPGFEPYEWQLEGRIGYHF